MEDLLDGVIVPKLCPGGVLLFFLELVCLTLAFLSVIRMIAFAIKKVKEKNSKAAIYTCASYIGLTLLTIRGGYYIHRMLFRYHILAFHLIKHPIQEVMEDAITVQAMLIVPIMRMVAFIILYAWTCWYLKKHANAA